MFIYKQRHSLTELHSFEWSKGVVSPALFSVPKCYSTTKVVRKLSVQNLEQELFCPYFFVSSFLEPHDFYLTMVFVFILWRTNILQMMFLISAWIEILLFSTWVEVFM